MGAAPLRHSRPHLLVAALLGTLCSLALAQAAPASSKQPSRPDALPRQLWAVAYTPSSLGSLKPAKLAALRKRGINAAVAFHLNKSQRARLKKSNARAKLALLTPLRTPNCSGPASATCAVEAASIPSATKMRGRRIDVVVVAVSGPAAIKSLPARGRRILALV